MAEMQWHYQGYFTFVVWAGPTGPLHSNLSSNLPVEAFSVKGGTTYTSFNAKQETDIKAQLEKAATEMLTTDKSVPMMPLIIDAVRARATVGEIAAALANKWGHYDPGT